MSTFRVLWIMIRFFLPPKSFAPESVQLSWRYKVASTLASIVVVFVFSGLLALGQFPSVTEGFASVADENTAHDKIISTVKKDQQDIAELKGTVNDLRKDQLDTKLYDIRGRQCAAMTLKNEDALKSEGERLRETLPRYRELTGEDWRIPPCNEY